MSSPDANTEVPSLDQWVPVALDDQIRIGRDYDGGYVIPRRVVDATSILVGLGINDDWSFEEHFARLKSGLSIVGIDGSVSYTRFQRAAVDSTLRVVRGVLGLRFRQARRELTATRARWERAVGFWMFFGKRGHRFHQKYLKRHDGPNAISWSTLMAELSIVLPAPDCRCLFVKMDIEGSEYDVLDDLLRDSGVVAGMTIEFHDCGVRWTDVRDAMSHLTKEFVVTHLHGNNCATLIPGTDVPMVIEVSLMHRSLLRGEGKSEVTSYPLARLDMPNDPKKPDLGLFLR